MLIIGALALIAATVFWKILPESRNFRASSLKPRSLLDWFVMHFKDAGLPWLFLEAFVLMGAFVTMFNYIGYRFLDDPVSPLLPRPPSPLLRLHRRHCASSLDHLRPPLSLSAPR